MPAHSLVVAATSGIRTTLVVLCPLPLAPLLALASVKWSVSPSIVSDCLWHQWLGLTMFFWPWDSPDKNTGVNCHFLLQEILPTQELKGGLLHCRQNLYYLRHQEHGSQVYSCSPVEGASKHILTAASPLPLPRIFAGPSGPQLPPSTAGWLLIATSLNAMHPHSAGADACVLLFLASVPSFWASLSLLTVPLSS